MTWPSITIIPSLHTRRQYNLEYLAPNHPANKLWLYGNRHSLIFKCSEHQKQPVFYYCWHCSLPFPLCSAIFTYLYTHTHSTESRGKERSILYGCLGRKTVLFNWPCRREAPCRKETFFLVRRKLLFSCLFPFHFPLYSAVSPSRIRV